MAKKCEITGKSKHVGNRRSKAMNATKHTWKSNLQKVKVEVNGNKTTMYVSARGLRTMKKQDKIASDSSNSSEK